jgi:TolB-like protein/Tfp pilus assembly protein PilF
MAFYEGETLKKKVERGRLPIGTAIDIAIQVAEGLERAHSADIIHRDIKPPNLMLTQRDEVVIVDFGLAKLAGELSLTKSGSSLGTPHYMSPEQARGDRVDGRTDLWSLGVVLFEMLAGRRPFRGENNTAVARAILDDEPPTLSELRPDAPPELGAIVAKVLAKDTDRRYQSTGEFLADLKGLQDQLSEREGVTEAAPSRAPTLRRFYIAPVLVAAALFFGTVAVVWFLRSGVVKEPVDTTPPRIVVLPFENLGPPEDEYFADGMTEEIISRLSAVSGLLVISRTSAMYYKGRQVPLNQIGEELNVQYALEGTVRWERTGEGHGRVRITPQLIKVADDTHLWSDRYDRAIESVFEVQSDIAEQVVGQLNVSLLKLEEDAFNARPTDSPEAHEAFLLGRDHFNVDDREHHHLAIKMFERAVELDPEFAVAWASLAKAHSWLYFDLFDMTSERQAAARQAVERALELDPALPEGHLALGYFYYWCHRDYEQALEEFARTLAIRPNDTEALKGRAFILRRQGQWEESTSLLERVFEVSPMDFEATFGLSVNFERLRDFRRAEEYADLAISLAPDNVNGYSVKFRALFSQGRFRDARAVFEELPTSFPAMEIMQINLEIAERRFEAALARLHETPEEVYERYYGRTAPGQQAVVECACYYFLGDQRGIQEACGRARVPLEEATREYPDNRLLHYSLGLAYAFLGHKEDAIREGERAVALVADDAVLGPIYVEGLARIYALVGEPEAAIDQIEYLLSIPSPLSVGGLRVHPYWDPLRDHPHFQAVLEEYDVEQ